MEYKYVHILLRLSDNSGNQIFYCFTSIAEGLALQCSKIIINYYRESTRIAILPLLAT